MKTIFSLLLALSFYSITAIGQTKFDESQPDLLAFNDTVKNKKGEILQEVVVLSQQQKRLSKEEKAT